MKAPPVRIVICCAEIADAKPLAELRKQLANVERKGFVDVWDRTNIDAGHKTEDVVLDHFARAQIILLLISSDLNHQRDKDLQLALAQRERGALIIPIRVRPVALFGTDFAELAMLPADQSWIANSAAAWTAVVESVLKEVERISTLSPSAPGILKREEGASTLTVMTKIKLLFLGANPTDAATRAELSSEYRAIDQAITNAQKRDRFELQQEHEAHRRELIKILLRYKPNILHFAGHGTKAGAIVLLDDQGQAGVAVPPKALTSLFETLREAQGFDLRCVVLSGCFSQVQAEAIAAHVPCVIGMDGGVDNSTCITFSAGLYDAFADGQSAKVAFKLAMHAAAIEDEADAKVPRIFYRPDVSPSTFRLL